MEKGNPINWGILYAADLASEEDISLFVQYDKEKEIL
jgi:hypothetical protein